MTFGVTFCDHSAATCHPGEVKREISHTNEITPHRDALAGLVDSLSHSHEQTMALESLPAHTTADGERSSSDTIGQPDHASVEDWFQQFGRDLAWKEQRANEPPAPAREPELAWSRDRDYDVDRSYDGGFGL